MGRTDIARTDVRLVLVLASCLVGCVMCTEVGRRGGTGVMTGSLSLVVSAGSNTAGNDEEDEDISLGAAGTTRELDKYKQANKELKRKVETANARLAHFGAPLKKDSATEVNDLGEMTQ